MLYPSEIALPWWWPSTHWWSWFIDLWQTGADWWLQHRVDFRAGFEGCQRCQGHWRLYWATLSHLQVVGRFNYDGDPRKNTPLSLSQYCWYIVAFWICFYQGVPGGAETHTVAVCFGRGRQLTAPKFKCLKKFTSDFFSYKTGGGHCVQPAWRCQRRFCRRRQHQGTNLKCT